LAKLRAVDPVYRTALPDKTTVFLLTRYEDVAALLREERFTKNRRSALTPEQARKVPWIPSMFRPLERNMLDLDPPDHTRLRTLVHKAFTPRLVEDLRARVQTVADELLEAVSLRGQMDVVNDYALPLPITIITEILGVPTRDRHKFHKWTQAVVSLTSPSPTLRVLPVVWRFIRYLRHFLQGAATRSPQRLIGSANRDENVFACPDELDLGREPNRHLSFGHGIHFCLGAPLARLEAQIAFKTLLRHMPHLRLNASPDSLRWQPSIMLRGLKALPVRFP